MFCIFVVCAIISNFTSITSGWNKQNDSAKDLKSQLYNRAAWILKLSLSCLAWTVYIWTRQIVLVVILFLVEESLFHLSLVLMEKSIKCGFHRLTVHKQQQNFCWHNTSAVSLNRKAYCWVAQDTEVWWLLSPVAYRKGGKRIKARSPLKISDLIEILSSPPTTSFTSTCENVRLKPIKCQQVCETRNNVRRGVKLHRQIFQECADNANKRHIFFRAAFPKILQYYLYQVINKVTFNVRFEVIANISISFCLGWVWYKLMIN